MAHERRLHACTRRQSLGALTGALLASGSARALPSTHAENNDPPPSQVNSKLALPDLTLLDGKRLRASDTEGQLLVLYWWASWCPFCALQSPHMDKLWVTHKSRGLRMVGLSIDRNAEDASAYLARKGYTFPASLVTPGVARVLPKPNGLPVTMVRGRDGRVLATETGQLFPEDVEELARFL